MARPLIGLSTYLAEAAWGVWRMPAALLPARYPGLVRDAGGLAAMLPPDAPGMAAPTVARLDAVVISGGPDVDPARYGEQPHDLTGPPAKERDAWELALIEAALESGTPLLGICRGMQLMNVALGGSLVQHLPETMGHDEHAARPGEFGSHPVTTVPGTRLAGILPGRTEVPTSHHQGIGKLGRDLLPSAHAVDGTVEGLEHERAPFALGVQWHPEMGGDVRLMRALVEAAG